MTDWTVEALSRNVHRVTFPDVNAGWSGRVLLRFDAHHDSPLNDEKKERAHLERAKEEGAVIFDGGDLFDVMGGRFDPRKTEGTVKPQHKVEHYFDAIRDDALEFYRPYADNFAVLGQGNHETSVLKHHNIHLTDFLSKRLREFAPDKCLMGYYAGYVFLTFKIHSTASYTYRIKYHHGAGGPSPVTKGVITAQRNSIHFSGADMVISGHIHNGWLMPHPHETVSSQGVVSRRVQLHLSIPGYKGIATDDHAEGWEVEKGFGPAMTGAWWLDLKPKVNPAKGEAPIEVIPSPLGWT